jgi:hypothetical protein
LPAGQRESESLTFFKETTPGFAAQTNGCTWLKQARSNNYYSVTIMKITNASKTTPLKAKRTAAPTAAKAAPKTKPAAKTIARKAARAAAPLPVQKITSEQIAQRAYLIWEQQGRPAGMEQEHWLLAEQQLKSSQTFTK